MLNETLLAFGTLFPIVNPFSTSLVFMKLLHSHTVKERLRLAALASLAACIFMLLFLAIGNPLMSFFGVTIYAFRVAGGLYLAKVAFEMLSPELRRDPEKYKDHGDTLAIVPLAIPLLSGPGALTSVLVLGANYNWPPVAAAIVIVSIVSYVVLRYAAAIQRLLGTLGTAVVERILGLIVLVVAIQFLFNGISGYLLTL